MIGGKSLSDVYFVCWEGSNEIKGAYVQPLNLKSYITPRNVSIPTCACSITSYYRRKHKDSTLNEMIDIFDMENLSRQTAANFVDYESQTQQRSRLTVDDNLDAQHEEFEPREFKYSDMISFSSSDNQYLIQAALESIFELQQNVNNRNEVSSISAIENSKRLLAFCPSWNELEANKEEKLTEQSEKCKLNKFSHPQQSLCEKSKFAILSFVFRFD